METESNKEIPQLPSNKYPLRTVRKTFKKGEITVMCRLVGRENTPVPEHEVLHLAEIGCQDREMAEYFGVSESSFRYNFSDILQKGRNQLKQKLREKQIQVAMGGDRVMLIWLGKQYLNQSDTPISTESTKVLPWNEEEENSNEDQP